MSVKIILSRFSDPPERRELSFNEETVSLGRDPSNAIPLPGTQISKHHARIERQGSNYYIVDLNSTNFTFVNGEKLTPASQHQLHRGDKVSIAEYELEISELGTSTSTATLTRQQPVPDSRNAFSSTVIDGNQPSSAITTSSDILDQWSKLTTEIQRTLEKFGIQELVRSRDELQARCDSLAEENRRLKAERERIPEMKEVPTAISPEPLHVDDSRLEADLPGSPPVLLQALFRPVFIPF